jgi:hypothetical protein
MPVSCLKRRFSRRTMHTMVLGFWGLLDGLPKIVPKCLQIASRCSKTTPRAPEEIPRWSQDRHKTPNYAPSRPSTALRPSKIAPKGLKTALRRPQDPPMTPQERPERPQDRLTIASSGPKKPPAPRGHQESSKRVRRSPKSATQRA